MFKECFSEQFPRISACSQLRKSWHKWFFLTLCYTSHLSPGTTSEEGTCTSFNQPRCLCSMSILKCLCNEKTLHFFFTSKYAFFTSKYAFISIMLVKMIPLFFLVIYWVPTWSWTLSSLTFNWPTLPLIFFFPHALTTGSRFVSQREALYQEEGSFLTWMNSLTKLEANQQHILFIFYQLFLLHRIHTWCSQNSPLKARLVGR